MNINTLKKAVIVIVIADAIVAFKVFNLDQYLTLAYMKESQQIFYCSTLNAGSLS